MHEQMCVCVSSLLLPSVLQNGVMCQMYVLACLVTLQALRNSFSDLMCRDLLLYLHLDGCKL